MDFRMKKIKFISMATAKQKISLLHITSHTQYRKLSKVTFMTYAEANKAVRSLGITSRDEYIKYFNRK